MMMISYAQNFEDVMLWRALQHVERGFYIDVGAHDPVQDSVTKHFYDNGWRGVNVEPVTSLHEDLVRLRPEDVNLAVAVGATPGEVDLWDCEIPGLATASERNIVRYVDAGRQGTYHRVPVRTLADICDAHVTGDIHFLKIDVEGMEAAVLEGNDFGRFRPWIVVIEATLPNSPEEVHHEWEPLLLQAGYQWAYADGLNRFYVAEERQALAASFRYPPNVFDGFTTATQWRADEARLRAEAAYEALRNSTSWRITSPLRLLARSFGALREGLRAALSARGGQR